MNNENKKVLFVEPRGAPANVFDNFMKIPLLGPPILGSIVKKKGYDVSVYNENISGDVANKELVSADVLCITAITATANRGKEIAKRYRKIREEQKLKSKVLFGGIHASMAPKNVIDYCDHVIVGEGENVIIPLLECKIKKKVVYAPRVENIDDLPTPDFSILKDSNKIPIFPIMTSRGCKRNCDFCSVTKMYGRDFRAQGPERVLKEIRAINKHAKGKMLFFADDTLALDPQRLEKILDLIIKSGMKIKWSAQVDSLIHHHPKLIEKMKKAGCRDVFIGFESVNPESLREMRKAQNVSDIVKVTKEFHKCGIAVCGMTMFGRDADSKNIFKTTNNLYKKIRLDYFQGTSVIPFPGTDWYKKLKAEDRVLYEGQWELWEGLHVVHKPAKMTPYELQRGIISCYRDFYSIKNFVREFGRTLTRTLLGIFSGKFPRWYPVIMRLMGAFIVKDWIKHNKDFIRELEKDYPTGKRILA